MDRRSNIFLEDAQILSPTVALAGQAVACNDMRHIWSLIAGVLIAPLAWFLIAFGHGAMNRGLVEFDFKNEWILGGLLIVGVGLLLGVIGSLRTSPVGALFAAVIFLGASMFALFAPSDSSDLLGKAFTFGGYEMSLETPLSTGVLGVVGGMLLLAVFSPARWRGSPAPAQSSQEWAPPSTPAEPWEPPTTPASSTQPEEAGADKSS